MELRWKDNKTKAIGVAHVTDSDAKVLVAIGYHHAWREDVTDDEFDSAMVEIWKPNDNKDVLIIEQVDYLIQNKTTKEEGVAALIDNNLILACYGRDSGEDDKTISYKEFFEEFNIVGFWFEEN